MLTQNLHSAYEFSKKWVELFYEKKERILSHPVWFIKGNSYLLKDLIPEKKF